MKQIKKVIAYSLFLVTATFVSCKKDVSSGERNQSPVANAGADQTITLPNDSLTLDGSASTDPDGSIASYKWTQIAGAVSSNIIKPELPNTIVRGLAIGVYRFELTVTDNGGLTARDSLWVTVQPNTLTASLQWQRAVGGTRADIAQCIQPTADGGYILAGNTNSQDGDIMGYHPGPYGCYLSCFNQTICGYFPDGLVVKLNNTGAIEWQNAIGGTAADNLLYIQSTADGGYIASGITYSNDGDVSGHHAGHSGGHHLDNHADAWIVKLSRIGLIQWQKVLGGGSGCDFANMVLPTPDGGYIIAGHTDSNDGDVSSIAGERDVWIVKLNSSGVMQWEKTLGGAKSDYAYSFQSTSDGGYILAGYSYSSNGDVSGNHGDADAWIVKINSSGSIQWQKSLGGSTEDIARSIQATPDGGYIVAGSTKSNDGDVSGNHGDADAWIVKLNNIGAIQWQKTLGGSKEEIARSIQLTPDGGYIVAGSAISDNGDVNGNHGSSDAWVVKLSKNGIFEWQKSLGGTENDFVNSIQAITDGYVIAGQASSHNGDVSGNHGGTDAWVVKLKF